MTWSSRRKTHPERRGEEGGSHKGREDHKEAGGEREGKLTRRRGGEAGGETDSKGLKSPRKWFPMFGKTDETGFQWLENLRRPKGGAHGCRKESEREISRKMCMGFRKKYRKTCIVFLKNAEKCA